MPCIGEPLEHLVWHTIRARKLALTDAFKAVSKVVTVVDEAEEVGLVRIYAIRVASKLHPIKGSLSSKGISS